MAGILSPKDLKKIASDAEMETFEEERRAKKRKQDEEAELREALEKAFDYRGDVTLTHKDGSKIEGYVFDRVSGTSLSASFVRILPKIGGDRLKIAYSDIAALVFSGRDPAAGKSWEAWVKKYWEKKASGGPGASLHPDMAE